MERSEEKLLRRARALIRKADGLDARGVVRDLAAEIHALEDACSEVEGTKSGPRRQPYAAQTCKDGSAFDGEMREEHESFGMASLSRRQHGGTGTRLFGSQIEHHPTTIVLSINRASRIHSNLAYDHYHHASGKPTDYHIVDIELSAAQFADLITNPNVGSGFPCTIREVGGITMERVPDEHVSEGAKIIENFNNELDKVSETFKPHVQEAESILAKKSIGKGDRQRLSHLITKITRVVQDHAPHIAKMFNETADKMTTHAKKEIEAYATSVVHAAGLSHLREESPAIATSASSTKEIEPEVE